MESIKTIVGQHLQKLFPEGPAPIIAAFCPRLSEQERLRNEIQLMKQIYENITHYSITRKTEPSFERYKKNLRFDSFGVYSYSIQVIALKKDRTVKRLGKWGITTGRHMNYAIKNLSDTWGFQELK